MEQIIIGILLLASVTGLTFIIERGLALRVANVIPPEVESALESFKTTEDLAMLRAICAKHPSALSRLLLQADKHQIWSKAENTSSLETQARSEISKLERGLVILEIVVGVAPLLGLVGTIYGLIGLFGALGSTGVTDASYTNLFSAGVAIALYATLLGLLTAIPSLVAWSYYTKKVEIHAVRMASLCDNFLRHLYCQSEASELEETRGQRRG